MGRERWTSETAACDRSWLERLGDRVVSTAGGSLLLMWGTQITDNINRGYRKLLAGWAPVHPRHDKRRRRKAFEMSVGCHYENTVIQKGFTITRQLMSANLTPMCRFIKRYNYA